MAKKSKIFNRIYPIISSLGIFTIIFAIIVFILALIFRPVVKVKSENFSGPHGYGAPIWEAVIEVNDGRHQVECDFRIDVDATKKIRFLGSVDHRDMATNYYCNPAMAGRQWYACSKRNLY